MGDSVQYEPFLTGYDVVFHDIFTLIDPGMNTSEIKPLQLAIPRNVQGVRKTPTPAPSPEPVAVPAGTRLLSKRQILQVTPSTPVATKSPREAGSARETRSPRVILSPSDNKAATETLMKASDFWLRPLDQAVRVRFLIDREPGSFTMKTEATGEIILSATQKGDTRDEGIEIIHEGQVIGEGTYIRSNSTFCCGVDTPNGRCEACAAVFNPSFALASEPRVFDFLIPALKKRDGKNNMFPIPYKEASSGLFERMVNISKEAIRMKTRVPVNSGNTGWDTTFDGRLSKASVANFVLYHDSSVRKDLCIFGKLRDNEYELEIGYPLSPLQGFLAGVTAMLPL